MCVCGWNDFNAREKLLDFSKDELIRATSPGHFNNDEEKQYSPNESSKQRNSLLPSQHPAALNILAYS